jgi:ATP-dependent DNA helicase RecQ
MEGHGSLRLTELSRPVLRGERVVRLRRDPERRRIRDRTRAPEPSLDPEAQVLWDRLRGLRRELAEAQGVPPYVIFGDLTLRELVRFRPRDEAGLSRISGIGTMKLERYGRALLDALAEHAAAHGRPEGIESPPEGTDRARSPARPPTHEADVGLTTTVRETLRRFRAGESVEAIAAGRALTTETVYAHLARCIGTGDLGLEQVVELSAEEWATARDVVGQTKSATSIPLQPLFEAFGGRHGYGVLRCVRAALEIDRGECDD